MNEGWIKLYRKFDEWEWFNISEMVHLFIYLLLNANHEDGEWRGVSIKRGQILTGLHKLNERTKISIQTIRTCLERLKRTGEINIQTTNQYSIITILNYESYQGVQQTTNKQPNKRLTNDQQTGNNKQEGKEGKELKKFMPPTIDEIKLRMVERGLTSFTAEAFHAHYSANGWMVGKNKMKDWNAALTTWNEKSKQYANDTRTDRRNIKRTNDLWN